MKLFAPNLNYLWTSAIVEELSRHGVTYFCISPGSRSTPLTLAAANHPKIDIRVCLDERGAAFHALGFARAADQPAALICTSGSALANYFPAVVEASVDHVPMIILSADRPPELRETGANQTIRQPMIFGEYVRWHFDLPCPDEKIPLETVLTTIDQAVARSGNHLPGPVHLNCMFREPLAPAPEEFSDAKTSAPVKKWAQKRTPFTQYHSQSNFQMPGEIESLFKSAKAGIIIVGGQKLSVDKRAILTLAEQLDWPVFPDIASGLRLGESDSRVIHFYDQLLLSRQLKNQIKPDIILQFGGRVVSKRLMQFIAEISPEHYILVAEHPFRHDPEHKITHRFECSAQAFVQAFPENVKPSRSELSTKLRHFSDETDQRIERFPQKSDDLSEPGVARAISQNIAENNGLFLGNSMPVRDMDMYACAHGTRVRVGANRGASGIDGTIASSIGFACGLGKPVTCVLGDLAFLHDLNSLSQLNAEAPRMIFVVINNNGGGIFSFLPVARFQQHFEKCFGTPHDLSFENAAKMFGLDYICPKSQSEFVKNYLASQTADAHTIIEAQTNRDENLRLHRALQGEIHLK